MLKGGTYNSMQLPFLLRFADPIPDVAGLPFRYDPTRQLAQVKLSSGWIDVLDSPDVNTPNPTKITEIKGETTDDR